METRRLILLMIFSLSLIMLWDNYQASIGNPTVFGLSTGTQTKTEDSGKSKVGGAPSDLPSAVAPVAKSVSGDAVPSDAGSNPAPVLETISVKTDVLELAFSSQGGQIVSSKLLKHPSAEDPAKPVQLFEQSANRIYVAQAGLVGVPNAPNHRTLFEVLERPTEFTADKSSQVLKFRATSGDLETIYTYTIHKDRYDIGFVIETKNMGSTSLTPNAYVQIMRDGKPLESDSALYATFTGPAVYTPEGKYQKVTFDDIGKGGAEYIKQSDSGWVAMIQHYFVSAIIGQNGPRENYTRRVEDNLYSVGLVSSLGAVEPNQTAKYSSTIYTGPQDQRVLETLAPGLDLVVDYGWLTVIAKPIYWLLEQIHSFVGNWGWAIILLTVLIKAVFFPLSAASYKSMAKMRQVAPRMQKLKEQHGDDKMAFQRAMMELYKREKINPLGGCMPILIQIPVFISLYWVLLASVEMRHAPWLGWIHDLSAPDTLFGILPGVDMPVGLLPIIMAVSMYVQTKLNPTPPDPMQAKVMLFMPIVFSFMFFFFPSGLVLYWVVNNVLSIAQQWVITKQSAAGKA